MALTPFQDTEKLQKDVDRLAAELEKLRLSYEQYFLGLEQREPAKKREAVANLIKEYSGAQIQNTRIRFRLQQAIARWNTFVPRWDKILREMEEGRYERDVFRARIRERPPSTAPGPATALDPFAKLFDQYVAARKKCSESIDGLSLPQFKKAVADQIALIRKKTGAAKVNFKIEVVGGKTRLKAVPKT